MTTRVAIVCDLLDERWESMDLIGYMLEQGLTKRGGNIEASRLCPPMRRRFSRNGSDGPKQMFNADRLMNRFWDYPRWLRRQKHRFDVFHIVDHSYAQLVHQLPAHRTIVTCHDLDAFRSLLDARSEQRPVLFRMMAKYVLRGLLQASRIVCPSRAVQREILARELAPPERVSVIPNGVHPEFSSEPDPAADLECGRLLGFETTNDLLHVGTTVPRKRVDVLIEVLARVRGSIPSARLIRVGGPLTAEQRRLAERLNVSSAIVELPHLERKVLAAVYRHASLTLMPSEREGFGLPLAESLACGTPAIASDLEVFREVGGDAAAYCGVADIDHWVDTVLRLLDQRASHRELWQDRRNRGLRQASRFSWPEYAGQMAKLYSELMGES